MRRLAFAAALVGATAGGITLAGQTTASPPVRQSFTSTTTAILVDVVVRDRKGRPVVDLTADDFEITEDGVGQKVDTFTRVSHGGGIGVGVAWKSPLHTTAVRGTPSASSSSSADSEDATTALVFDHLSAESLRLAQKATLEYIPREGDTTVRVGVFATEPGVRVLQRYTTDRGLVRQAVQRVMPSATGAEEQKAERTDELLARRRELTAQNETTGNVSSEATARNAQNISARDSELQMLRSELDLLRADASLDRANKGHNTAQSLLNVVRSLAQFPGRKTIVFFSEGLPVSPSLSARLDWVIDAANRANITAYAVDANGLRAKSTMAVPKKEMDNFVEERFSQLATGTDRTDQPLTMAFERVEDTMRLDSRTGLARLAEETGGVLVEGSNNLTSAFRRIDEDNQFHYLLTYSPRNSTFDGKFRAIKVKVHRPATQVFARKGYRAVGTPRATDTMDYEVPALALLGRAPLPNAFPVHAAGFSFPDPARAGLTPLVVHVATDVLHFGIDHEKSTYSAQMAIVVRLRDDQGREVQKLSQQYVLTGDAKDVDAARKGDVIFYREAELPPGVYTMESIVFDALAERGSARMATITVPGGATGALAMSSLVVVRRVEEMKEADAASTTAPLYVGRSLIYPNAGEAIRKSASSELPFYFTLYGDVRGVTAEAQLLRNGQPIAEAPVPLAAPIGGRLQHVGRLPIAALPQGTYELRIRVTAGGADVSRAAFFTLVD